MTMKNYYHTSIAAKEMQPALTSVTFQIWAFVFGLGTLSEHKELGPKNTTLRI